METSRDQQQSGAELSSSLSRRPSESSDSAVAPYFNWPARGFVPFSLFQQPFFYIVSIDLVFVGLRISFGSGGPASRTWALWFGLAGYTLLLATTACFLIRVGKLWDDLRSLLLLIVMMFLAPPTVGDDTMVADQARGSRNKPGRAGCSSPSDLSRNPVLRAIEASPPRLVPCRDLLRDPRPG